MSRRDDERVKIFTPKGFLELTIRERLEFAKGQSPFPFGLELLDVLNSGVIRGEAVKVEMIGICLLIGGEGGVWEIPVLEKKKTTREKGIRLD